MYPTRKVDIIAGPMIHMAVNLNVTLNSVG